MGGVCLVKVVLFPSNDLNRKYDARDFDIKFKSANLLKILKGEHLQKNGKIVAQRCCA